MVNGQIMLRRNDDGNVGDWTGRLSALRVTCLGRYFGR
jgi:hypothetical protein